MNIVLLKKYIKSNIKMIIGSLILIIIIFYILNIYYSVVKYSVNTLDDFIHYTSFKYLYEDRNFDLFDFAKKYAIWDCVNLGGRYFTMFIQILLGPNPYTDIIKKNEIVMAFNMFLYFFSNYIFISTIVFKIILKNSTFINKLFISLLIFLGMLILHNSYQFYYEIFTWFSAATSYSIPLSLLLLSISFFIILIESNSKFKLLWVIPISICSICALGGSLSVLMIAFILMLSLLVYILINQKITIVNIGILFHFFCFALINVRSPGNYHRLSYILERDISTTNELFDPNRILIVLNTVSKFLTERYIYLFGKFNFIVLLLLISCVLGFMLNNMTDKINYFKTFMVILPLIFLAYFVCISFASGYQDKLGVTDRCYFVIDFSIIFTMLIVLTYGFILIYNIFQMSKRSIICELIIIMIIVFNLFFMTTMKTENNEKDINKIELITVAIDSALNKYEKYHKKYIDTINVLTENKGKNIAKIKYIDNNEDDAPKYLMKFCDGKHLPFFASDNDYLTLFYDIDDIIVLEK